MRKYKLSDFCTIGSSKRIHLSDYVENGVPFYRSKEIIELSENKPLSEPLFISFEKYNEIKSKFPVPKVDDILITSVGTLGKIHQVKDDFFYFKDGNLTWIRDYDKNIIDVYYLYHWLRSSAFQNQISNNNIGAVQKALTIDYLKSVDISLPNLQTQQKIAQILSNLDRKIALNQQINHQLEKMAKTLYDYWFVQFDFPDENGKPYKSSGGEMVWCEELKREVPKGWGVTTVGDITNCLDSKRIPLSTQERRNKKGIYPYYGATGILDYIDNFIFDGDYVLVAEDGSIMDKNGNPILQRITGKNWINNHAHVLEPKESYSIALLMMLLKDISVIQIKTGSIQMKINQENLNKYKIISIPSSLKENMNQKLSSLDRMILNNIQQTQMLTQYREFLLPMLMNGQVEIQ